MSVMNLVYQILTGNGEKSSLENFVRSVIGIEKVRISDYVMELLSLDKKQNADVLNFWKCILRDEVGLAEPTMDANLSNMHRLYRRSGNVLEVFYSMFTPEHIFEVLKEYINADDHMKEEALKLIFKNRTKGFKYKKVVDMDDPLGCEQIESISKMPDEFAEEFLDSYLVRMDLIIKSPKSKESCVSAVGKTTVADIHQ